MTNIQKGVSNSEPFSSGRFAGLYKDTYILLIHNISSSDSGYYWCQIITNGTCFSPSPYVNISVNTVSKDEGTQCLWVNYGVNPVCATKPCEEMTVHTHATTCSSSLIEPTTVYYEALRLIHHSPHCHTFSPSSYSLKFHSLCSGWITIIHHSPASLYLTPPPSLSLWWPGREERREFKCNVEVRLFTTFKLFWCKIIILHSIDEQTSCLLAIHLCFISEHSNYIHQVLFSCQIFKPLEMRMEETQVKSTRFHTTVYQEMKDCL